MFNTIKKVVKWIGVLLITAFLSSTVIASLIERYVRPDYYTVYFVGDFDNDDVRKIWDGFEKERGELEIDKIKVEIKKKHAKEADADSISKQLAEEHDTLMVIGHLYSTPTKAALPNYLKADPPIPVILALESNPDLLPPTTSDHLQPVFRLSPTDEGQAAKAAEFAVKHGAKAIWVVEDESNPIYSHYLAEEFIKQAMRRNPGEGPASVRKF
jgi:hypothetical protein